MLRHNLLSLMNSVMRRNDTDDANSIFGPIKLPKQVMKADRLIIYQKAGWASSNSSQMILFYVKDDESHD